MSFTNVMTLTALLIGAVSVPALTPAYAKDEPLKIADESEISTALHRDLAFHRAALKKARGEWLKTRKEIAEPVLQRFLNAREAYERDTRVRDALRGALASGSPGQALALTFRQIQEDRREERARRPQIGRPSVVEAAMSEALAELRPLLKATPDALRTARRTVSDRLVTSRKETHEARRGLGPNYADLLRAEQNIAEHAEEINRIQTEIADKGSVADPNADDAASTSTETEQAVLEATSLPGT